MAKKENLGCLKKHPIFSINNIQTNCTKEDETSICNEQ
jgi:hypothetical protein